MLYYTVLYYNNTILYLLRVSGSSGRIAKVGIVIGGWWRSLAHGGLLTTPFLCRSALVLVGVHNVMFCCLLSTRKKNYSFRFFLKPLNAFVCSLQNITAALLLPQDNLTKYEDSRGKKKNLMQRKVTLTKRLLPAQTFQNDVAFW